MPGAQVWEGTQQLFIGGRGGCLQCGTLAQRGRWTEDSGVGICLETRQQRPQVELSEDLPDWGVGEGRRPELNTDSTLGP